MKDDLPAVAPPATNCGKAGITVTGNAENFIIF